MIEFDWQRFDSNEENRTRKFEKFCVKLLKAKGFKNVKHREGSADKGRDIQAIFQKEDFDGTSISSKYFIECKCSSDGVPLRTLCTKILWADKEKPNVLLIITNSHLTTDAEDWIEGIQKEKSYEIRIWSHEELNRLIKDELELVEKYFPEKLADAKEEINILTKPPLEDEIEISYKEKERSEIVKNIGSELPILHFKARIDFEYEAGSAPFLSIKVDDVLLDEEYVINKPKMFEIGDGRTFSSYIYYIGWQLRYSPNYKQNYFHPRYNVLNTDPYLFLFDLSKLGNKSEYTVKFIHSHLGDKKIHKLPVKVAKLKII